MHFFRKIFCCEIQKVHNFFIDFPRNSENKSINFHAEKNNLQGTPCDAISITSVNFLSKLSLNFHNF